MISTPHPIVDGPPADVAPSNKQYIIWVSAIMVEGLNKRITEVVDTRIKRIAEVSERHPLHDIEIGESVTTNLSDGPYVVIRKTVSCDQDTINIDIVLEQSVA